MRDWNGWPDMKWLNQPVHTQSWWGPAHYLQKFSLESRKFGRFGASPHKRYTLPAKGQTASRSLPDSNDFIDSIRPTRQIVVHKIFISVEIHAKSFHRNIMHNIHYAPTKAFFFSRGLEAEISCTTVKIGVESDPNHDNEPNGGFISSAGLIATSHPPPVIIL
eukprot:scaffold148690_cov42-Cyclotella_meneghiniana.AAC.2